MSEPLFPNIKYVMVVNEKNSNNIREVKGPFKDRDSAGLYKELFDYQTSEYYTTKIYPISVDLNL